MSSSNVTANTASASSVLSPAPLSGILRRPSLGGGNSPGVVGGRRSPALSSPSSPKQSPKCHRVHFEPPPDLSAVIRRYRQQRGRNSEELEGFTTHMRNQTGQGLVSWLQVLQGCIALLKPDLERFVVEVLKVSWATQQDPGVVAAFRNFLANLVTAHAFYTKHVVYMLVSHFLGRRNNSSATGVALESEVEQRAFSHVHEAIKAMLELAPLSSGLLLKYSAEKIPYVLTRDCHAHTTYLKNLTVILGYLKSTDEREALLKVIVDRLVQLDAHLSDEDDEEDSDGEEEEGESVFKMEEDKSAVELTDALVARRNLDPAMDVMLCHVESVARDEKSGAADRAALYRELLGAFEAHVLPAYATGHVQFLMFKLLAVDAELTKGKAKLTKSFFDWLWSKFCNPNTPAILRQSCAAYMASLVARAKWVDLPTAQAVLQRLVQWVHAYIAAREEPGGGRKRQRGIGGGGDYMYADLRAHGPFYAACQSALYVFAFRHEEFVSSESRLAFLRGLNLATVVTCRLNPLRVCLPSVVRNFAAVSRRYQLVYCDAVVERNSRINLPVVGGLSDSSNFGKPLLLDSFFPFDPYKLKGSSAHVDQHYRVYEGAVIGDSDSDESDEEEEGKGSERGHVGDDDDEEMNEGDDDDFLHSPPTSSYKRKRRRSRMESTSSANGNSFINSLLMGGSSPGFKC